MRAAAYILGSGAGRGGKGKKQSDSPARNAMVQCTQSATVFFAATDKARLKARLSQVDSVYQAQRAETESSSVLGRYGCCRDNRK